MFAFGCVFGNVNPGSKSRIYGPNYVPGTKDNKNFSENYYNGYTC